MKSFIKKNQSPFSDWLLAEARGLEYLQEACQGSGIRIPKIIEAKAEVLILEKIETKVPDEKDFFRFGEMLARFHQNHHFKDKEIEDNFIGLNQQKNSKKDSWGEFFFENRLLFQVHLMNDLKRQEEFLKILQSHQQVLINFINQHCSHLCLVHGDLWSGNFLFDGKDFFLIDPAVYIGDPETDLAMSKMFGGFPQSFYQGYRSHLKADGYTQIKHEIYQLYHYLNHFNLFGSSYLTGCLERLKTIASII